MNIFTNDYRPCNFTVFQIVTALAYVLLAFIFVFSLAILKNAIIIKAVKLGRVGEFFRVIKNYGQYPADIYSSGISTVFRYLIPLALLAYYPSTVLIEKADNNLMLVALVTITIFLLSRYYWQSTLKSYTSAGG